MDRSISDVQSGNGALRPHLEQGIQRPKVNPLSDFERNPKVCGGETVFKGTRVLLRTVLASLAEGDSFDDLLKAFPSLTEAHLKAAVAFAASSALEDQPVPAVPKVS